MAARVVVSCRVLSVSTEPYNVALRMDAIYPIPAGFMVRLVSLRHLQSPSLRQLASDHQPLDFAGTLVDLGDFCIAEEALDRVLF